MNRLRELREARGLSLRALGEKTGIDYSNIAYYEKDQRNVLERLEWTATAGSVRQYAKWLDGIGLAPGRTIIIDSNPGTQKAVVEYSGGEDDVSDYQEPNPQYINFIDIYPGNNQIVFNFGTVENVNVDVTYTEQVRAL